MPNSERHLGSRNPNSNPKPIDTSGSSIPHWAEATSSLVEKEFGQRKKLSLEEKKKIDFAKTLAEPPVVKAEGLRFLKEHSLPRYKKIAVNLAKFLDSPQKTFKRLVSPTGLYYSSIINSVTGERVFGLAQNQEDVRKFILEKLAKEEINLDSKLTLSEYWPNYYGGNLLINKNGVIFIELVEGKHAKLVKSEGQVLMSAQTETHTRILQFSNNQEIDEELQTKLRQTLLRTIDLIPKKRVPLSEKVLSRFQEPSIGEEGQKYLELPEPGYFEFILTKENEEAEELKTIFIDARTGSAADKYQLSQ
jgi:hypothetical protein